MPRFLVNCILTLAGIISLIIMPYQFVTCGISISSKSFKRVVHIAYFITNFAVVNFEFSFFYKFFDLALEKVILDDKISYTFIHLINLVSMSPVLANCARHA